jgi:hypothetical protein
MTSAARGAQNALSQILAGDGKRLIALGTKILLVSFLFGRAAGKFRFRQLPNAVATDLLRRASRFAGDDAVFQQGQFLQPDVG